MTAYVLALPSPMNIDHHSTGIPHQHQQHSQQQQFAAQAQRGQSIPHRRHVPKPQFALDLSQRLFEFVIQLLPTAEEMAVKEDVRKLLERLIRTIEPDSRLLSFGSTANGFSLRNSDMDLCCLIDSNERLSASDLVTMLGDLLERETKFHVKPLPMARIPIVKLSLDPSPGLPHGIACDIGFENRLALENTRLLMCYAMIDPARVRILVLFLKVWSKRRKINSPYTGTLSSYGYVLLVIYFLVHVKNPPVLPNLQQIPPLRPIPPEEHHMGEHNIWFFDDIDLLRQRWQSSNRESVGELLIDFFKYYSRDFPYNTGVASIRAGALKKDAKGWVNAPEGSGSYDPRERNRVCIEDPFELDYNVGRCVTKEGLYMIRGEFMRASRILAARPEHSVFALAQLCEERIEEPVQMSPSTSFVPARLSIPPQTPYAVGGNSMRPPKEVDRLSPPPLNETTTDPEVEPKVPGRSPPEHMAPQRGKYTSPPPPEAPPADHSSFANRLGLGLSLATSSTDARERDRGDDLASSSNSEISTDDEPISDIAAEDDARSIRSFADSTDSTDRRTFYASGSSSFPHRLLGPRFSEPLKQSTGLDSTATVQLHEVHVHSSLNKRGRRPARLGFDKFSQLPSEQCVRQGDMTYLSSSPLSPKRSASGPPRMAGQSTPFVAFKPAPPSPTFPLRPTYSPSTKIYYETTPPPPRHSVGTAIYPTPSPPISPFPLYQQQLYYSPHGHNNSESFMLMSTQQASVLPPGTLKEPGTVSLDFTQSSHSHNTSTSTIIAPTTPSARSSFNYVSLTPTSDRSSPTPSASRAAFGLHTPPDVPVGQARRPSFPSSPSSPASVASVLSSLSGASQPESLGSLSPVSPVSTRSTESISPISPKFPVHAVGKMESSVQQPMKQQLRTGTYKASVPSAAAHVTKRGSPLIEAAEPLIEAAEPLIEAMKQIDVSES